jgi:hypothetical protein
VYSLCKKDLAEIDRKHVENGDDLDDDDDDKEMEIIVENGKVTNGYLHHNGVNEKESVI